MIEGVWAAALTPIDADLLPDVSTAVPYYLDLLQRGCDGINALGTTGEAMSLSAEERLRFMDALASSDLPMERMMAGTGAASLSDAARLTRHAFECGFAAALVMPPFFYRDAAHDGIVAFFDALFELTNPPRKERVALQLPAHERHHILSGARRSSARTVSRNDRRNEGQLERRAIYKASSSRAIRTKQCFPARRAAWSRLRLEVSRDASPGASPCGRSLRKRSSQAATEVQDEELTRRRAALDGIPFIAAVRYLVAAARNDPAWERAMPPNVPLTPQQRQALSRR